MILDYLDNKILALFPTGPEHTSEQLPVNRALLEQIHYYGEAARLPHESPQSIQQRYVFLLFDGALTQVKLGEDRGNDDDALDGSDLEQLLKDEGLQRVVVTLG